MVLEIELPCSAVPYTNKHCYINSNLKRSIMGYLTAVQTTAISLALFSLNGRHLLFDDIVLLRLTLENSLVKLLNVPRPLKQQH